jgi:hypothetical protein
LGKQGKPILHTGLFRVSFPEQSQFFCSATGWTALLLPVPPDEPFRASGGVSMKNLYLVALLALATMGCASYEGGSDLQEFESDGLRERGTTGLGAGSDTTTQTGIDTGTRTGSGLR